MIFLIHRLATNTLVAYVLVVTVLVANVWPGAFLGLDKPGENDNSNDN